MTLAFFVWQFQTWPMPELWMPQRGHDVAGMECLGIRCMRQSHTKLPHHQCPKHYYYTHEITKKDPNRLAADWWTGRGSIRGIVSNSTGGLSTWLRAGSLSREEVKMEKGHRDSCLHGGWGEDHRPQPASCVCDARLYNFVYLRLDFLLCEEDIRIVPSWAQWPCLGRRNSSDRVTVSIKCNLEKCPVWSLIDCKNSVKGSC